jgi:hypothetical protein
MLLYIKIIFSYHNSGKIFYFKQNYNKITKLSSKNTFSIFLIKTLLKIHFIQHLK